MFNIPYWDATLTEHAVPIAQDGLQPVSQADSRQSRIRTTNAAGNLSDGVAIVTVRHVGNLQPNIPKQVTFC